MTVEIAVLGLLGFVILVLGVIARYRGNRLAQVEAKFREAQFRADAAKIEGEVRELEKKSRESGKAADDSLADYLSRVPSANVWRPGPDDTNGTD